ncbi:BMC domain-containing protein [Vibrio sp. PP-XX7]
MIETVGLTAAIEVADAAIKSANVNLIGYELKENGIVTVKFEGEVNEVHAAVSVGCAAVSQAGQVSSHRIIAPVDNAEVDSEHIVKETEQDSVCDFSAPEVEVISGAAI